MSGGLWRKNPATNAQQQLTFGRPAKRRARITQADVITAMLRKAHSENRALNLPEIMDAGIAQFTARIFELRERGFVIENELRRSPEGQVLSRYWLRFDPERDGAQ
jgi:Helix-turn-helix domain